MYVAFYEDSDKDRLTIVKTEPDDVGDNELVIDPSWPVTRIQALASAQYDRIHAKTNSIYRRLCNEAYDDDSDDSFHWLGYPKDDDYDGSMFARCGRY